MSWDIFLLGVAVLLALASAVFSALETAIFLMNASRRRTLRLQDPTCAARLDSLLDRPSDIVNLLVIADRLVDIPLIVLSVYLLEAFHLDKDLTGVGMAAVALGVVIIFGDLAPKLLAFAAPSRMTRLALPVVHLLLPLLGPLCDRLTQWCHRFVDRFAPARLKLSRDLTEDELSTLIEIGREEGNLGESESRIIHEINKLAGEAAKHCMTPRVDAFTLPDDLSNEDAMSVVRRRRYRYVPVRGETPDDIVGVLDVKRLLLSPEVPYPETLQPPSFVPDSMNALDLLQSFLRHRQSMAILVDEFGGIKGVVTLSDIVEELMGEEGPASRSELYIERIGDERLLASGSARLDDLSEYLGFDAKELGVDTVSGLVTERLGAIPTPGAQLELHGWRITVRRATRKRIKEVLIEPIKSAGEER